MTALYIILIIIAAIVVIALFAFLGGARSTRRRIFPQDKGQAGEDLIATVLKNCAETNDKIINDILLYNKENGKSVQIDHIFINRNGVYVVETKNYSGKIYGNDSAKEWTQYIGDNIQKFYSPVKQNKSHLYVIGKILNENIPIHGIIVFVQGNIEHIESNSVYTPSTLHIAFQYPSAETPLDEGTINRLYHKLCKYRDDHPVTQWEHLDNIRKTQEEIANNICPRCNGKLVLRDGKYGKFYGCSNYPKCKFTKEI